MRIQVNLKKRQSGAVAVIVGVGLAMLIGFLALVIDLGHLYLARAGQQNAADASALAGAKELDGTVAGIDRAVEWARKLTADCTSPIYTTVPCPAQRNRFLANLGWEEVALPEANIHFGADPYTSDWKTIAEAKINPGPLTFIKVDTETGALGTWFAAIWNILDFSTYGSAVAGRFMTSIAPMGVCALDPARDKWVQYDADPNHKYKVEHGYMRGVSYDLENINKRLAGLASGDALYIHPMANSQTGCIPNQGSAGFAAPFLCMGRSAISGLTGSTVYTNTGLAAGVSIAALNTRFDIYGSPLDSSIDHTVCPPDENIRAYQPAVASNWMAPTPNQTAAYLLYDWLKGPAGTDVVRSPLLAPASSVVAATVNAGGCNGDCSDKFGVLWLYSKPVAASGSFTRADWPALYPLGPASNPAYAGTETPAYSYGLSSENSTYYQEPSSEASSLPVPRRVVNVVLVDCPAPAGGICRPMTVRAVGRFFMQRTATVSAWIAGEFAGLVPESELSPAIRLYR